MGLLWVPHNKAVSVDQRPLEAPEEVAVVGPQEAGSFRDGPPSPGDVSELSCSGHRPCSSRERWLGDETRKAKYRT